MFAFVVNINQLVIISIETVILLKFYDKKTFFLNQTTWLIKHKLNPFCPLILKLFRGRTPGPVAILRGIPYPLPPLPQKTIR